MMNESTGATLRHAREQRHLTLQQVAEKTKIRSHYLQALEYDDFAAMPSSAQARGFLRIYADFLGLDVGQLVAAEPSVDAAAATLPSSILAGADNQDAAPRPGTSRPSLFSILRDLWSRRGGGNVVVAPAATADSSAHADASGGSSASVAPAGGSASAESPGGESRPEASADDLDEAKKKGLN
jgi:cytoskeletal protein RodZ